MIHSYLFACGCMKNLPVHIIQECAKYNTISECAKVKLVNKCLSKKYNHDADNQIDSKLSNLEFHLNHLQFVNEETKQQLSKIAQEIKLSEQLIIKIPKLFEIGRDKARSARAGFLHCREISNILFGNKTHSITDNINKLLVFASRQILDKLMINYQDHITPQLDCWRFLYGFLLEWYNDDLFELREVPYLNENLAIPGKKN